MRVPLIISILLALALAAQAQQKNDNVVAQLNDTVAALESQLRNMTERWVETSVALQQLSDSNELHRANVTRELRNYVTALGKLTVENERYRLNVTGEMAAYNEQIDALKSMVQHFDAALASGNQTIVELLSRQADLTQALNVILAQSTTPETAAQVQLNGTESLSQLNELPTIDSGLTVALAVLGGACVLTVLMLVLFSFRRSNKRHSLLGGGH